jgi:hypothetical protein
MRCVLGQHDETGKKEKAIYYLSKKFTECESRYMVIEKLCCVLVWVTKWLQHYILYMCVCVCVCVSDKPYLSS